MSEPEIAALVICDDIRREDNGKHILLGVYSGGIVVRKMPFRLHLALWIEYLPVKEGTQGLRIRLRYSGEDKPAEIIMQLQVQKVEAMGIPIPGLQLAGKEPGELTVDYSIDDGANWKFLRRKPVQVGKVNTSLARPTPVSSEPGNL